MAFACSQPGTLNRVDNDASGGIADDTAGFVILVRASSEVIGIAVENSVSSNHIGGQGR